METLTLQPATHRRRKRISKLGTAEARQALVQFFTDHYPPVKRLHVRTNQDFFYAHAYFGPRVLHAKAYSLERLKEYFIRQFEEKVVSMA